MNIYISITAIYNFYKGVKMNKFGYLMLGLLATSAMAPAIIAMEDTEAFDYDARSGTAAYEKKQVYFTFQSALSQVQRSLGVRIKENLIPYLTYEPRGELLPTMEANFDQAVKAGFERLNAQLDKAPRLDRGKVLDLFNGLVGREFRIYEGLLGRANEVIGFINSMTPLPGYGDASTACASYNCLSITIHPTQSEAQFHFLGVASLLSSESERLSILNPSLINLGESRWSLLAYLVNSKVVLCGSDNTRKEVKQELLNLYHAYATGLDPKAAEYKVLEVLPLRDAVYIAPSTFNLAQARIIAEQMKNGNMAESTPLPQIAVTSADILAAARAKGGIDLPIVAWTPAVSVEVGSGEEEKADEIIAPLVIPAPRSVEMFTAADITVFDRITTALDTLHVAQEAAYRAGKKFHGYSRDEQIMAFGDDSVIRTELRTNVRTLLEKQLTKRGIVMPGIASAGYDAAARDLADWIREKTRTAGLAVAAEDAVTGMIYTKNKAQNFDGPDRVLFNTIRALHSMSIQYDNEPAGSLLRKEIEWLLTLSFSMIIEHNGRCGAGAKGRDFLMQVNMLKFFKEQHPTIEML
jgi:hypothetical protein